MKKYRTLLIDPPWRYHNVKTGGSMLFGSAQKYQTLSIEELWVCIKGKVKAFRCQKPNFLQTKALAHSQKPEEIYEFIEPYALEPKAELFARRERKNWDCFGNDIDGKDIRKILK